MRLKRKLNCLIFLGLLWDITGNAQPCENGFAGVYPCSGINQYAFLSADEIGGGTMNDNWGWVSPQTGREYAIQGRSTGTSFIDITDPYQPVYIGNLPTHDIEMPWRDIKVYSNHAFIVSEGPGHGMQVFDLTQLDDVLVPPVTFTQTAHYNLFGNAHNIAINEATGFAYVVGSNTFSGGLHFIDIQNPTAPFIAGGFEGDGYTHDVQVVIYHGSDLDYSGKEIAFASNENTLTIVDVTDKADPLMLSRTEYDSSAYAHQGWLTEDHRYFLLGDEMDEGAFGVNTRTFVWDIQDLEEPQLIGFYESHLPVIDHNLYIIGDYCYQANYTAGLRVLKLNNLSALDIEEVAYFDVLPDHDNKEYLGSWNAYPFFPSGTIILSSMEEGMHILQPDFDVSTGIDESTETTTLAVSPNPASDIVRVTGIPPSAKNIQLFDITGKLVWTMDLDGSAEVQFATDFFSPGIYLLRAANQQFKLTIR